MGDELCEPFQVLSDCPENELVLGSSWTAQSEPVEPQDALQVCEPHLNALAIAPRLLEGFRVDERPGHIPGTLIDAARYLTRWRLWTASGFELAQIAIELASSLEELLVIDDRAGRRQVLAGRTRVDVEFLVE